MAADAVVVGVSDEHQLAVVGQGVAEGVVDQVNVSGRLADGGVPGRAPGFGLTLDRLLGPVQLLGDRPPLRPFGFAASQGVLDGQQFVVRNGQVERLAA